MKRKLFRKVACGGPAVKIVMGALLGVCVTLLPGETENAVANGDTRTIQLYHVHTKESISATYLVNGSYDQSVLEKLNWFLRDWRRDEATKMDPRLFDTIWEVYRESGSRQPIEVMSAYRSPETNAMLRRRSRGVAEHSQHILGKAMDQHYFDVPMSKIREIAMRLQHGGVGFYPTAGTPFVHMDVGGVRHWPRMSYDQLARLFPDGKTVHIPSNGQPLPGYEEARAELEARGGQSYPTASDIKSKGFFAWLFGGGSDEEEDAAASGSDGRGRGGPRGQQRVAMADRGQAPVASYQTSGKNGGQWEFLASEGARSQAASAQPNTTRIASAPTTPQPAPPVEDHAQEKLALAMSAVDQQRQPQADVNLIAAPPPAAAVQQQPMPELTVPPATLASSGLTAPMPPRRPVELADASEPDLPLPPIRPSDLTRPIEQPAPTPFQAAKLAKADGISSLLAQQSSARQALPAVITQGASRTKPASPPVVLAYASSGAELRPTSPVPLPVPRPADMVSARLDRSNFRSLTSVVKSDKTVSHSTLGSSVVGIRAAARANLGTFASNEGTTTRFGSKAYDLSTDRFSGPAIKPTVNYVTAKPAETANRD